VANRPGADKRRDRLLEDIPTKAGFDRDEYPPAVGRGKGLVRGSDPKGWKADVMYVESSENQSHGASLGRKLRRVCNGTRFRYVFR
jgi:Deoxyribonuclease NucA/NucB